MDPQSLFSLPYRTLRGHRDKIFKPSARTDIQKQFSHIVLWIPGIYCLLR